MLETYLHAKKWLRPGGKMFPTAAICISRRSVMHLCSWSS